ncbi:hypothetical protein VIBNIAM115_190036 [Vibrio nigripulchritudo AM115]|nr:hypothetical protein VIBNIAM115_190036 [Vibrio nigripulchritudo AM115]
MHSYSLLNAQLIFIFYLTTELSSSKVKEKYSFSLHITLWNEISLPLVC